MMRQKINDNRIKKTQVRQNKRSNMLYMAVIFISSIFAVGTTFHLYNPILEERIDSWRTDMSTTESIVSLDNAYQKSIDKITSIVKRYNPKLSTSRREAIAREIYEMSIKYANLDVDLICATITHESARTWDSTIVSEAGAMGLMQIMPKTGAYLAGQEGIPWTTPKEILFNPIYNIQLGCGYLSMLIDSYEVDGGLAAYNGGLKRAEMWLANDRNDRILWEETRNYIPAVLKLYDEFRNANGFL